MPLTFRSARLALAADDFEGLVDFYTRLLGRAPDERIRDVYAEFHLPGLHLGLFKPGAKNRAGFARSAPGPLGICLDVSDLDAAVAHVAAEGCPPVEEIRDSFHGREFEITDPEGNRIILHQLK